MPLKNCFVHGEQLVKFNIMFLSAVVLESKLGPGCLILRLRITRSYIHTHTSSTTPLNEWSACGNGNSQQTRESNICAANRISTHDTSNQEDRGPCRRPHGHWNKPKLNVFSFLLSLCTAHKHRVNTQVMI